MVETGRRLSDGKSVVEGGAVAGMFPFLPSFAAGVTVGNDACETGVRGECDDVTIWRGGGVRFALAAFTVSGGRFKEPELEDDSSTIDGSVGTGTRGNDILGALGTFDDCGTLWPLYASDNTGTGGIASRSFPLKSFMNPLFLCLRDLLPCGPPVLMDGSEEPLSSL